MGFFISGLFKKSNERKVLSFFWCLFLVGLIFIDQISKWQVFKSEGQRGTTQFFDIEPFRNYNFVFSINLPTQVMYFIYLILFFFLLYSIWTSWVSSSNYLRLAWVSIMAGAISNIGERLWIGYVRDFIKAHTGFFNFADLYIIIGLAVLIIFSGLESKSRYRL